MRSFAGVAKLSCLVILATCGDSTKPPVAVKVAFTTQPVTATAGDVLAPAIVVEVQDADGNLFAASNASVTLSISSGSGASGATLGGTLTKSASGGDVTFDDITIDKSATGYTLTATATGLTSGTSSTFDITAGPAAQLVRVNDTHGQSAQVGSTVPLPPAVTVVDAHFNAVSTPTSVTFKVREGTGTLTGAVATSNSGGVATLGSWKLESIGHHEMAAVITGMTDSVFFAATATGGTPATMALHQGDGETVNAGDVVQNSPAVLVKDANGYPAPGAVVTFQVTGGGGSVSDAVATSGNNGVAMVGSWTTGDVAGTNTLTATSPGLTGSPVNFTANGVAGPGFDIFINAGNGQSAQVSTTLATAPSVVVKDFRGNPVGAGLTVEWEVQTGNGQVTSATSTTNASGIATMAWTLGATPGSNTLKATFVRQPSGFQVNVTFTATGTP